MNARNILLITTDQQHWHTLGCMGAPVKTPNLDRLAAQGCLFERAYCPNPLCTPTRSSIITGLMPSQHGAWTLGTRLDESTPTIGALLQSHGYDSALIGKAHFQPLESAPGYPSLESYPILQDLDFWRNFDQDFYGFNHVELARNHVDEAHVGQHYAIWMEEKGCRDWRRYFRPPTGTRNAPGFVWEIPTELHYNTWITERASERLTANAKDDKPFFCWASYFDPHPAYLVPEPWASMYDPADIEIPGPGPVNFDRLPPHFAMTQDRDADWSVYHNELHGHHIHGSGCHLSDPEDLRARIAIYYGMVSFLDHAIGQLLEKLDALGLAERTLVVFTSDHGHYFGQHGLTRKGPFHFEDGIRVPFMARMPGAIASGSRNTAIQSLVDLAPTFCGAAGIDVPHTMSGLNQLPAWCGQAEPPRDHALIENRHNPTTMHLVTYVDRQYKITVYRGRTHGELYDLENDPRETINLWDDPRAAELKSELLLRFAQAQLKKDPLFMPRIAGA
ncbi:MAG: sulfatase-like hydrolase/transferase [Phycisphaeraceae bacterium]|nr:sulfatase-like hydrolase/transferase [Phycisphaeraceae bacterium]